MAAQVPALAELVLSLEQATLMAKQLQNTTDPSQVLQIYSTLQSAHHRLSSFLSQTAQTPLSPHPTAAAENSFSSAIGYGNDADENGDEPMQVGDDGDDVGEEGDAEQNLRTTVERVEERMRDCYIRNKRPKRQLSPSSVAAAEQRRSHDREAVRGSAGFDPQGSLPTSLELIYQFHG